MLQSSDQATGLKVVDERVERVSRDKVHFWVKVANESDRPVFLIGIQYRNPRPYYLFLEQWRTVEGWKAVVPCMDMLPEDVITLKPGGTMRLDFLLKVPLSAVCKERNVNLEGRFRYRLEYFYSKKDALTYVKLMDSPDWKRASALSAVSESFEISPPKN